MNKLKMVENIEEFKEVEGSIKMLLITSENCGACKMMEPTIVQMRDQIGFPALSMDGPSNMGFTEELGVTSVPILLYYKDNKIVGQNVGYVPPQLIGKKAQEVFA